MKTKYKFEFETENEREAKELTEFLVKLQDKHQLKVFQANDIPQRVDRKIESGETSIPTDEGSPIPADSESKEEQIKNELYKGVKDENSGTGGKK